MNHERISMINAAIVGLGRWGKNLVNSVQGKSDKIRFVAGATRTVARAKDYAAQQGFTLHDDYAKVLADPAIDAVVLATPHTQHARQVVAAAEAGKHVFVEKPFTMTLRQAQAAVRACAEHGVTLAVGYNWRFQPALQEIKRMLEDGRLGRLLHIEGNFCGPSAYRPGRDHWRHNRDEGPAGGMTGRGVHVVDAMLYLAGQIDTVHAQSYRLAQDFGLDDTTSMLFHFRSGATGYLGTIIATAETWRMQVFGSKGWAEVGDVEHLTTWQMRVCYVDPDDFTVHNKPQTVPFFEINTERAELENFAAAVAESRPLAVAGGDEEHGVAVMEAIVESARAGVTVQPGQPAAPKGTPPAGRAVARSARPTAARRRAAKKKPRAVRKTARSGKAKRRTKASARR
jgi:predicted dehydrogenase